ncbi:hypothetical protein LO772_08065 [Yinghuangia sp. ASG 101]|uniref:hypothetical protein n=1 Tax=Yinghuangia sp. ASG 101 TaxID=2896848 RepID=UPI001E340E2A|nr:hypothetical protein [Yinghuangia sp. ASG 101]UGQ13549.1 hypothetical protein LO772_08065 [Yinghuangia sp. ASG 101]
MALTTGSHSNTPASSPFPSEHGTTAGLRAIDDFGRWVENADAKAAVVTAALGSLGAGLISQARLIQHTWHLAGEGTETPAGLLGALLLLMTVALVELGWTVLPSLVPSGENRHSFPWVAANDLDTVTAAHPDSERDAWRHAQLLADIACTKLRHLRRAICATGLAATIFLTWFLTVVGQS